MAENLKCSMCGEEATVHLTQIVNNKIIKVDLCEACAQAKGVTDPEGFSLADLMNKNDLTPQQSSQPDLVCTDCGMETSDFRKTGRLGCAGCFSVFATVLRPVLEDMHVGVDHKGKVPENAVSRLSVSEKLRTLEAALESAIVEEAYEDAAKCRDEIRELQEIQHDAEVMNP